ncbi:MAG: formylmethanofuran--tetrahydromethanopterin N-formyltransferase [Planctomycetota bacterium]
MTSQPADLSSLGAQRDQSRSVGGVRIEDDFAEAFPMYYTRVIVTAADDYWLAAVRNALTGFGTSVIACDMEIDVEQSLEPEATPDGRPGIQVMAFAMSAGGLRKKFPVRVGQCVLTCPTAAIFAGNVDPPTNESPAPIGQSVRFFGDGHQISKKLPGRHVWRVPVMDGEFLCEHNSPIGKGIGGGNFLLLGRSSAAILAAARAAIDAIAKLPGVIAPFPGGAARSGSKVGSKYPALMASTNDAYCPTLRGQVETSLRDDEHAVLEIVLDGQDEAHLSRAIDVGVRAAVRQVGAAGGLSRITAGNYGGKLGPHHFHLHRILFSDAAEWDVQDLGTS